MASDPTRGAAFLAALLFALSLPLAPVRAQDGADPPDEPPEGVEPSEPDRDPGGDPGGGAIQLGVFSPGHRGLVGPEVRWIPVAPLFVEAGFSLRGYQRYAAGLAHEREPSVRPRPGWSSGGADVEAAVAYTRLLEPHFWGVGSRTPAEARSDYRRDLVEAGVEAAWRPRPGLALRAALGWERNEVRRGHDEDRPDLHDVFDADDLVGAGGRLSFARLGLQAVWDGIGPGPGDRLRGVWGGAGYRLFLGTATPAPDFHVARAEIGGLLPLDERSSVEVSALGEVAGAWAGEGVPFYHLPAAGGDDVLRGFRSGRFRHDALLALRAEYAHRIVRTSKLPGWRADAFGFADAATVAAGIDRIRTADVRVTPGLGLRIHRDGRPVAEAFVAFGGEELRFGGDVHLSF